MTNDIYNLKSTYFDWICSLVSDSKPDKRASYKRLLLYLNSIIFTYTIPMDGNRYEDGINLRYRFGYEHGIEDSIIASYLDDCPCSVLEMMVALAFRCEEHIMFNPSKGMRPGRWFWEMIHNLGLSEMKDSRFDERYVDGCINRFLDREYTHDGEGGLVYIPNSKYDMRTTEIWYQMMRFLSNYRRNGD